MSDEKHHLHCELSLEIVPRDIYRTKCFSAFTSLLRKVLDGIVD